MCHSKFIRKEFGLFVSNCGNSETYIFLCRTRPPCLDELKIKSLGLWVSSPILPSLILLYMSEVWWLHLAHSHPLDPHPYSPISGTLTLPRRSARPGAQLRVSSVLGTGFCDDPQPGTAPWQVCSITEVASQLTLGWGDRLGGLT